MAAHKHAVFIKAWADGEHVEVWTPSGWTGIGSSPSWNIWNVYRIKPAEPERAYPETTLTDSDLIVKMSTYPPTSNITAAWRGLVNMGLRCAHDRGEIVTRKEHADKVKEAVDYGAAIVRKMAFDMAKAQPGPGGLPLTDGEISSIASGILKHYAPEASA